MFAILLNPAITGSRLPLFTANLTVKHDWSSPSSTHAATTFFGSFVVAARNAKDSANSFSRWRSTTLSGKACSSVFHSERFISDGSFGVLLRSWSRMTLCSRCAWSVFRHSWRGIPDGLWGIDRRLRYRTFSVDYQRESSFPALTLQEACDAITPLDLAGPGCLGGDKIMIRTRGVGHPQDALGRVSPIRA